MNSSKQAKARPAYIWLHRLRVFAGIAHSNHKHMMIDCTLLGNAGGKLLY